jgi:hypothetical protein
MAEKSNLSFDEFAALCPDFDIEVYRDNYGTFLDINGAVMSHTIGFHFTTDEDDHGKDWKHLAELLSPVAIWAGSKDMLKHINGCGHSATLVPYFEGGGFMVVLKLPITRKKTVPILEKK